MHVFARISFIKGRTKTTGLSVGKFFCIPLFLKEIPVYEKGETFLTSPERYTPDGKNREFSWRSFSEKPHLQGIKIKNHVLKRKTTKKSF